MGAEYQAFVPIVCEHIDGEVVEPDLAYCQWSPPPIGQNGQALFTDAELAEFCSLARDQYGYNVEQVNFWHLVLA